MSQYQKDLLADAKDMWKRGFDIPTRLFAEMTQAGLDVEQLKTIYKED